MTELPHALLRRFFWLQLSKLGLISRVLFVSCFTPLLLQEKMCVKITEIKETLGMSLNLNEKGNCVNGCKFGSCENKCKTFA